MPDAPPYDDRPTFARPPRPLEYVPGRILVRVRPEAVRPHVGTARVPLTRAGSERLPDPVFAPVDYLRRNAGLKAIEPLFSSRRSRLQRAQVAPAARHRLGVALSVADVESDDLAGLAVASVSQSKITPALLKRISASPEIDFAERMPARWLTAAADPMRNLQWGLRAVRWFEAASQGRSAGVAILDTGIDRAHPDLPAAERYEHAGLKAEDIVGHGTHVAGVIAAKTNNAVGITGMAQPKLAVWKIFGDDPPGGRFYVDSERYLQALGGVVDAGVSVVNLSIGGAAGSQTEALLFRRMVENGVTPVAAMGNEYEEGNQTSYPAAYDGVISVGAVAEDRRRSRFSNTGRHIDLVAPGSNILSTLPTRRSKYRTATDYGAWSGTSMATPHVAAAAALLAAKHPDWSPQQIHKRLCETAARLSEMGGRRWTEAHGNGLLDVKAALS